MLIYDFYSMAVNVMTMEEREKAKKLRGLKKFKEDVKKVGKKVGGAIKRGAKAVGNFAVEAAKDPLVQKAALSGAAALANHYLYGSKRIGKTPVDRVVEVVTGGANDAPRFFQNKPFADYTPPMAHNPKPVEGPKGYKVPDLRLPTDDKNKSQFGTPGVANKPLGRHPVAANKKK